MDFNTASFDEVEELLEKGSITKEQFMEYYNRGVNRAEGILGEDLSHLKLPVQRFRQLNYYVYLVKVDGEVKYVGKGTKDRYKHAVTGTSSVAQLNRDFFQGKDIEVFKAWYQETSEEAEEVEKSYISSLRYDGFDLYNKTWPCTKYLGDGYLDLFEKSPCAKAIHGKTVDIEEYLQQKVKREILRECFGYDPDEE